MTTMPYLEDSTLSNYVELANNEQVFVDTNEARSSKYFAYEGGVDRLAFYIDFKDVSEVDVIDALIDRFRKIAAYDTLNEYETDSNDSVIAALKTAKYTLQTNLSAQSLMETFEESFGISPQ